MENTEIYRLQLRTQHRNWGGDAARVERTVFAHTRTNVTSWAGELILPCAALFVSLIFPVKGTHQPPLWAAAAPPPPTPSPLSLLATSWDSPGAHHFPLPP